MPINTRDGFLTKDSKLVNCYFEPIDGQRTGIVKRPGLVVNAISTPVGTGLGNYAWNSDIYEVRGTAIYKNGVSLGTVNATGGKYYFAQTGDGTKLVFKNTTNAYFVTTGGTLTAITSPNYPTTTVPGIVYMDGYIFVMTPLGQIYNSDLEDPTTWGALNFITAETEPDNGVAITKHMNYVVALGQWSIEFFYDAANAPPGSPILPADNAFTELGCANGDSVVATSNTIFWISRTKDASEAVHMLNGFQPVKISTDAIDRIVQQADISKVYSFAFQIQGHYFYVLTFPNSNITIAYDVATKSWSQYTATDSLGVETYLPVVSYADTGTDYLQHESNGLSFSANPLVYQDAGNPISTRVVTDIFDGGTNQTKFMHRLELIGDTVSSTIKERHSDDDYQTFSSYRDIDLSTQRKQAYRYGKFRRRSFEFLHTANTPLRLEFAEIDLEVGTS